MQSVTNNGYGLLVLLATVPSDPFVFLLWPYVSAQRRLSLAGKHVDI